MAEKNKDISQYLLGRKVDDEEPEKKPYGLAEPEEPEEEIKPVRNLDTNELAKRERLNQKLRTAKSINIGGFGFNSTAIISLLVYGDSMLSNPDTINYLNNFNETFGLNIDFESIIQLISDFKMQIMGLCVSSQTMLLGYKQTVQRMRDSGNESFKEVFEKQLEEVGI